MFEKLNLKFKGVNFNKDKDISTVKNEEFNLPLVNAKDGSNGIMYYGRQKDFDYAEMTIDIVSDGAISTGNVYSQPQKTGVLYNAYLIKSKFSISENILNFFASSIYKSIKPKFGYDNKAVWGKVKKEKIELPTKNGKIDFDFMESFISELDAQRIAELDAYLTLANLKDYELTREDQNILNSLNKQCWKEFMMGDLFERIRTKKLPYKAKELPKELRGDYTLPVLTSSFMNQGLNYFAPKTEATILKGVITIPSNSDIYRSYYQSREFSVLSDAYAIDWKNKDIELSPNGYLFVVSCINKVTDQPIYSYKNKLGGWNIVKNKYIKLPVDKNGEIDFNYIENLIQAIKKLLIKDVVKYSDRKLETTKVVVKHTR